MNILLIGCGCVGKCFLELLYLEKCRVNNLTIIEPKVLPKWLKDMYPNVNHIKKGLTKSNMKRILEPFCNVAEEDKPMVVDVSVNTSTLNIVKLCSKIWKCNLINTSIEDYEMRHPEILDTDEKALYRRSLMCQNKKLEKMYGQAKTTALILAGENPGEVSYKAIKGLCDYTEKFGNRVEKGLMRNKKYNLLARSLGLEKIHISEIDTQVPKRERPKDAFWGTWSVHGMIAEARDPVQISDRIIGERGMDVQEPSICVGYDGKPIHYTGSLVPHGEAYTISNFLKCRDYMPDVYYVYCPSEMTRDSLDMLRENDYKDIDDKLCYVLGQSDLKSGWDSVGCLLQFNCGRKWWCGSVLSLADVKKLGFKHSGPTPVQVAINMLSSIRYIQKNKKEGLLEPEDLEYKSQLARSKDYLGKMYSLEV